jgi:hypothetical protein
MYCHPEGALFAPKGSLNPVLLQDDKKACSRLFMGEE